MKDTLIEISNNLQRDNSRVDEAENQINDLEHKEAKKKTHQSDQEEKRTQKNEDSVSNLRNNFKQSNIRFIGMPEREEEDQETGNLFEKIIQEKFTRTNSGEDEAENQNDLEHRKEKAFNQKSRKNKEFKKMRIVSVVSGAMSAIPMFASQECQKEKRKSKKLEIYLKK